MKKIMALALLFTFICSFVSVYANEEITVILNGEELEFDVPAQMIQDRTLVPMRKIFESLGATVEWAEADQLILASYESKLLSIVIGNQEIHLVDVKTGEQNKIFLDVPAQIINDRTLVPLRAVAESLSAKVEWDEATKTVTIIK